VLGADGAPAVLERFPDLREDRYQLELEVSDADERSARVGVTSSLRLAYEGRWDVAGVSLAEVIALPEPEAELVGWISRRGEGSLREVAEHGGGDTGAARALVASLVERGIVAETSTGGEPRYAARAATRRGGRLPARVWEALAPPDAAEAQRSPAQPSGGRERGLRAILLGRRGRSAIATTPVLAAFLAAEWMVLTGSGSFTGIINFVGIVVVALLAGVLPVLLLVSSRRKGEHVPAASVRRLGNPVLLGSIYLLFVAGVFLHGLVIWDDPFKRGAALLAGVAMVAMTLAMARRGAFAPRTNLELRDGEGARAAEFALTAAGRPAEADVLLEYPDGEQRIEAARGEVPGFASLRRATFRARPQGRKVAAARELKIWVHRVNPEQESQAIPAQVEVHLDGETCHYDLELSGGQVVLPLSLAPWRVEITLAGC
jgi:hypothetical protein